MGPIRVGITGINAIDSPGPGIAIARSLKESPDIDVEIVGLAYDALDPGVYMDWVIDQSFKLPYPSEGGERYLARLAEIQQSAKLNWFIPSLDAELPVCIKYADRIRELGIDTFLPEQSQFRLRGKDQLGEIAEAIGLRLPETEVVTSEEGFSAAIHQLGWPAVVKGIFYEAHKSFTAVEAFGHYHKLVANWGLPIIVQKLVQGDELNVVGVGDGEGNSLGLVGMKKVAVTSSGKAWSAVTVNHSEMMRAANEFVKRYRWKGPFELECIISEDEVFLIEVNPRFPAWTYLATGAGVNLPDRMMRFAMGLGHSSTTNFESGKLMVRYSYELISDIQEFQKMMTRGERR